MSLLKFFVGPVASGKTIDLILRANQLQAIQGAGCVRILKPSIDTRFSPNVVRSASGLEIRVTNLITPIDNILNLSLASVKHIVVDEIQFFTVQQIEQLREISLRHGIEVFCYGLLLDFKLQIFESSKRLLELCDEFIQLRTYCLMCNDSGNKVPSLASHNLKIVKHGDSVKPVVDGSSVCIGGIDTFLPVCFECYARNVQALKD